MLSPGRWPPAQLGRSRARTKGIRLRHAVSSAAEIGSVGASARRRRTKPSDEAIHGELFQAILDHRLPPGTALPEDGLAAAFGVSRTVVRKALIRLAGEKLVELRHNRGAAVARPTVEEARQLFDARRLLEPALVRLALQRPLGQGGLDGLRANLEQEARAFAAGDRQAVIRLSGEFHAGLAAFSGNGVLVGMLRELISRTSLVIALYERAGVCPCSLQDHGELLEALAGGDGDAGAELMRRHLDRCEAQLDLTGRGRSIDLGALFRHVRADGHQAV